MEKDRKSLLQTYPKASTGQASLYTGIWGVVMANIALLKNRPKMPFNSFQVGKSVCTHVCLLTLCSETPPPSALHCKQLLWCSLPLLPSLRLSPFHSHIHTGIKGCVCLIPANPGFIPYWLLAPLKGRSIKSVSQKRGMSASLSKGWTTCQFWVGEEAERR